MAAYIEKTVSRVFPLSFFLLFLVSAIVATVVSA